MQLGRYGATVTAPTTAPVSNAYWHVLGNLAYNIQSVEPLYTIYGYEISSSTVLLSAGIGVGGTGGVRPAGHTFATLVAIASALYGRDSGGPFVCPLP